MITYIKNFITVLLNINKNPKAFTFYLLSLIFLGLNYALKEWFNTSLTPELIELLTEVLFPIVSIVTGFVGAYFTKLVNTGDEKWTKENVAGKDAFVKE